MNNEIISYILHFELPGNSNNNDCEIIKKRNDNTGGLSAALASTANSAFSTGSLSLFNCFTRAVENKMVNCINNSIQYFAKQKNNYDDIIRL